jgi:transposase-like protein
MRFSTDLRKRVIDFVRSEGGKAETARQFQVLRGSVYNWTSARDGLSYRKPGPKGPRSLDLKTLRRYVETHVEMM